jgi:hypothetical protein
MEFEAEIRGEDYHFSSLNGNTVLVSGKQGEYILYKNKTWRCADELPRNIIAELGEIIEERLHVF